MIRWNACTCLVSGINQIILTSGDCRVGNGRESTPTWIRWLVRSQPNPGWVSSTGGLVPLQPNRAFLFWQIQPNKAYVGYMLVRSGLHGTVQKSCKLWCSICGRSCTKLCGLGLAATRIARYCLHPDWHHPTPPKRLRSPSPSLPLSSCEIASHSLGVDSGGVNEPDGATRTQEVTFFVGTLPKQLVNFSVQKLSLYFQSDCFMQYGLVFTWYGFVMFCIRERPF